MNSIIYLTVIDFDQNCNIVAMQHQVKNKFQKEIEAIGIFEQYKK